MMPYWGVVEPSVSDRAVMSPAPDDVAGGLAPALTVTVLVEAVVFFTTRMSLPGVAGRASVIEWLLVASMLVPAGSAAGVLGVRVVTVMAVRAMGRPPDEGADAGGDGSGLRGGGGGHQLRAHELGAVEQQAPHGIGEGGLEAQRLYLGDLGRQRDAGVHAGADPIVIARHQRAVVGHPHGEAGGLADVAVAPHAAHDPARGVGPDEAVIAQEPPVEPRGD